MFSQNIEIPIDEIYDILYKEKGINIKYAKIMKFNIGRKKIRAMFNDDDKIQIKTSLRRGKLRRLHSSPSR